MITFVLMEPEVAGNVGAVARVLKNFGFSRMVIINPKCRVGDEEALHRSKHARDVLSKAVIAKPSILQSFHTVIATTSKLGTDYNIPRSPITPDQLVSILPKDTLSDKCRTSIAILFGREGIGLTNKEVLASDFVLTIPSQRGYPTLNLSHSVAIVAYELSKHRKTRKVHTHIALASLPEKRQLSRLFSSLLDCLEFGTKERKETQKKVWKRLFARSFMSKREAFAAMGLFRVLLRSIKK